MEELIDNLAVKALYIAVIISLVPVGAATCVGFIVATFQTLTQIQEQTLPFFFKMITTFSAMYFMSAWASATLLEYCKLIFESML